MTKKGGTWEKGRSGNPIGRPPVANSIAGIIREKTKGGAWIVKRALELAESADEQVSLTALRFLADFGFVKPAQQVDLGDVTTISLAALVDRARKERGLED